jgi:hypothetical protein
LIEAISAVSINIIPTQPIPSSKDPLLDQREDIDLTVEVGYH